MFIESLSVCKLVCFSGSLTSNSQEPVKSVYLRNWPCQARPTLVHINSYKTFFFNLFFLSVSISVTEVLTLLMIDMLEYVFQIK